jgi:hypothetical protein
LLEENIGRKLHNIGLCNDVFLNLIPKAQAIKEMINKWGYIKLRVSCMAKEGTACKDNLKIRRKYFQNMHPTVSSHPK